MHFSGPMFPAPKAFGAGLFSESTGSKAQNGEADLGEILQTEPLTDFQRLSRLYALSNEKTLNYALVPGGGDEVWPKIKTPAMKRKSGSQSAFFNLRILTALLAFLAGIFLALFATANPPRLGFAAFSNAATEGKGPPKTTASTADARTLRGDLAFRYGPRRHLDEHAYRPSDITFAHFGSRKNRGASVAGNGAWSLLGPPGGDVADVAVSTVDPNIVLAGIAPDSSFGGALYRSADGGTTWSEVPALAGTAVYDIEFAAGGNAYIATLDSVWKSTDGGLTWIAHNLGIGVNDQVFDVALDPSDPSILWAGIADASGAQPVNVMRSTDGGATWANRTPPLGQALSCQAIAVDPGDSNTVIAVFAGAFGGGQVWVTTSGGSSWTNRSAGLPNNPMRAVVYDGTRLLVAGGQLFGSQNVGLYKSTNLGATWTALHNNNWPRLVAFDVAVDPNDAQTILVATDGTGVHRTTDGGASWQISIGGTGALAGRSLRFQPGSSTELFLGTSSLAVFRSTDGGDTFASSSRGISALTLFSIHANPLNPDELAVAFQGSNNGGVLSSTDGGGTWLLESAPPTRYSAVRFAPGGMLYAISSGPSTIAPEGLYRRENNGSWTSLGPNQGPLYESDLDTMRFSFNNPALILLGGADFGVAGSEGTIWRTSNAGQTWTKVYEFGDSQPVTDIEIVDDGLDQVMIASHDDYGGNQASVLRSTDGGLSWLPSGSGLPTTFLRGPRLCASTNDPQAFYLSGFLSFGSSGLFHTSNGGMTWVSTGWTGGAYANDVACHPNAQLLFISLHTAQDEGPQVVRSTDGGATFLPFADGLEGVVNPQELAFAGYSRLLLASGKGSYGTELLGLPTPTPSPTPTSTPSPTATATPSPTPTPTSTPTPAPNPAQALNISTRLRVETGNNVMIGGFIITGSASKNVAVRGIGPSLAGVGLGDVLADPVLELRGANGSLLFQNDNWRDDPVQAAQLTALGLAPQNSNESGIVATLLPGAYTAVLAGENQGTGIGLVEIYDVNQTADSQLANISTRGFVQTGDDVMIGGFILGGSSQTTGVIVRGIGPSLAQFGLSNLLADPTLELRDSNGALLTSNNDWQDDPISAAQLTAHNLVPQNSLESGVFAALPPGAFTAILAGNRNGIGIGLLEIYNVQ
jgi:photosystem II stability/assembly factor-like uncharacterized protein